MTEYDVTISSKGQFVLPKEVRDEFNLSTANKYTDYRSLVTVKVEEIMSSGCPALKSRGKKIMRRLKSRTKVQILIRPATIHDIEALTNISFASKHYWNYPEEYFEIWKDELTITASYIQNNKVYLAEAKDQILGYFSLVEVKNDFWAGKVFVNKGFWLEHIFIQPKYIGKGIGAQLIDYLKSMCKELDINKVRIFSDPNARGFYDKMGARYIGESLSSIEGRTVSLYELDMKSPS